MRIPAIPPNHRQILADLMKPENSEAFQAVLTSTVVDSKKRYLHWDKVRFLKNGALAPEYYWLSLKLSREKCAVALPFYDKEGNPFRYCSIEMIQEGLHLLDRDTGGTIQTGQSSLNGNVKNTYIKRSLLEESISSSQLEGASTTSYVAKEMIRKERQPRDKSEQMIYNNFQAMQFIRDNKDEELTVEMVCELQKILTDKTLEPQKCGHLRSSSDVVNVVDQEGQLLHEPPEADELQKRLEELCEFANHGYKDTFVHPVIQAIVLHFQLAYIHPFADGNGRTARALFYWAVARHGYWLLEFISISKVIKRAPIQYGKAFLFTETDDNDMTYFILQQLGVIKKAVEELQSYLDRKMEGLSEAQSFLSVKSNLNGNLNFRQLNILRHALKHPKQIYSIQEHRNMHGVAYQTARTDLLEMADTFGLLDKAKQGRGFVFISPEDLTERIHSHG